MTTEIDIQRILKSDNKNNKDFFKGFSLWTRWNNNNKAPIPGNLASSQVNNGQ